MIILMETFEFNFEYEFDYEYDFFTFEVVILTTRSSAILVLNKRAVTRFDPTKILRSPVKNLVVPKSRTHSRSRGRNRTHSRSHSRCPSRTRSWKSHS